MAEHNHATPMSTDGVKTIKAYVVGFALSLILTLAAFALVAFPNYSHEFIFGSLTVLALAQLLVQIICFLRLNVRSTQDRWNLLAFIFTLLVVVIVVSGSMWIMYNTNYNMMH